MPKKGKKSKREEGLEDELWIAPRYNMKGPAGERAWENRQGGPPNQSRYLELADIALGVKKPAPKMKHTAIHEKTKRDPYSH
ncbi:MAG TPA: hypothetical protein VFT65_06140 [Candidatus Angelobacter sp.]|nr:hypothetical protein [Candidatus Angelobacter sp.]HEU4414346.1 hypothetical protein [Candidatus Angelobacter sp.]